LHTVLGAGCIRLLVDERLSLPRAFPTAARVKMSDVSAIGGALSSHLDLGPRADGLHVPQRFLCVAALY
jgi:hypothetical protein